MAEAAMVMIVLLFFLLLAPAIWLQRSADQHTRVESHRDTFARGATLINLPSIPTIWGRNPKAERIPTLSPNPPQNLRGYKNFKNSSNEGRAYEEVDYSAGIHLFRGSMATERRAYIIRPSWTWAGAPLVHTQDLLERNKIVDWFKTAHNATLKKSRTDAFKMSRAPL